jgi:hypothetical protein
MPAHAETVGSATVWADTTRLYPMGQEGGLIISGATFRAAVAALIARYPFAVAARSPSLFRSKSQPAVSQSVQVHT